MQSALQVLQFATISLFLNRKVHVSRYLCIINASGSPMRHAKGQTMDLYESCTSGLPVPHPMTRVNSLRRPRRYFLLFPLSRPGFHRKRFSLRNHLRSLLYLFSLCPLISFSLLLFLLFSFSQELKLHPGKMLTLTSATFLLIAFSLGFSFGAPVQNFISRHIIKFFFALSHRS